MKLENILKKAERFVKNGIYASLISLSLLSGCSKPDDEIKPAKPSQTNNNKPNNTTPAKKSKGVILDNFLIGNLKSYSNGTLSFNNTSPKLDSLDVGGIISSEQNSKIPYGLLGKITYISGDKKTINVTQASLTDIVENGTFSKSQRLIPASAKSSLILPKGVHLKSSSSDFDFNYNFDKFVLIDLDGSESTTNDQVTISGDFSFSYSYNINLTIKNFKVDSFSFTNNINQNANLSVNSNIQKSIEESKLIFAQYFPPFTAGYIPSPIGPIPIVIAPEIDLVSGVNGKISIVGDCSASEELTVKSGIAYQNSSWGKIEDYSVNFNYSPPEISSEMEFKVFAGPKLELLVYGLAGTFGELDFYARMKAVQDSKINLDLYGGLDFNVGVKASILGKDLLDKKMNIFNYEKLLYSKEIDISQNNLEGIILFASDKDYNTEYWNIYAINLSTNELAKVTDYDFFEEWPSFSNGTFLFGKKDSWTDDWNIFTQKSLGSEPEQLVNSSADETSPAFSPNGKKIAYESCYAAGHEQIYIINLDGTNIKKLTSDNPNYYRNPFFSPESDKVFCISNKDGGNQLYSIDTSDLGVEKISLDFDSIKGGVFSPDGSKIAISAKKSGSYDIYIMDRDFSNLTQLTSEDGDEESPCFSPDGKNIVYVLNKGKKDLWIVNLSDMKKYQITSTAYNEVQPCWIPAGSKK